MPSALVSLLGVQVPGQRHCLMLIRHTEQRSDSADMIAKPMRGTGLYDRCTPESGSFGKVSLMSSLVGPVTQSFSRARALGLPLSIILTPLPLLFAFLPANWPSPTPLPLIFSLRCEMIYGYPNHSRLLRTQSQSCHFHYHSSLLRNIYLHHPNMASCGSIHPLPTDTWTLMLMH